MLSRTADNLFWAARYMERADFNARILDAAIRLSSLPASYAGQAGAEWESALITSDVDEAFAATGREPTEAAVKHYLAFDYDNPSSIVSCVETARANSRAVRTALTPCARSRRSPPTDGSTAPTSSPGWWPTSCC